MHRGEAGKCDADPDPQPHGVGSTAIATFNDDPLGHALVGIRLHYGWRNVDDDDSVVSVSKAKALVEGVGAGIPVIHTN